MLQNATSWDDRSISPLEFTEETLFLRLGCQSAPCFLLNFLLTVSYTRRIPNNSNHSNECRQDASRCGAWNQYVVYNTLWLTYPVMARIPFGSQPNFCRYGPRGSPDRSVVERWPAAFPLDGTPSVAHWSYMKDGKFPDARSWAMSGASMN